MRRIDRYLFFLANKYIFINFIIIAFFILFLNFIELSRILNENEKNFFNFILLSLLKFPSILNEVLPFVIIIGIAFLLRNLINNNELISMRNLGYSIFDIFIPIGLSVFTIGVLFLLIFNPIGAILESKYEEKIKKSDNSLYSIKISGDEMWIKNMIDEDINSFINIKKIDLKDMKAKNIKILKVKKNSTNYIQANEGVFNHNIFELKNVIYYDLRNNEYRKLDNYSLNLNFNKKNIIDSIENYRFVPYYNYIPHITSLKKFNLYSSEISLFYLSEILKPIFIVMLSFVIVGIGGKFKRNENFFKVLFISIMIGFGIFLLKEIITKLSISLSLNFFISYLLIFIIPFLIGLYTVIRIEND